MKPTIAIIATVLASPALLHAGEAETTQTTLYRPEPAAAMQHQGWFLGGGADYLFDAEEPFYNGHLGYDFGNGSSLFLESGWLGQEEEPSFLFPFFTADVDVVPVTLNYKYEYLFTETFGLYAGVGAGASNVDVSAPFVSDDDWVFTAQAFAGVVFNVSPNFEIYAGGRYVWLDDVDLFGTRIEDLDDFGAGAGIRFNF
jgi:opacity protein-like surface antigen